MTENLIQYFAESTTIQVDGKDYTLQPLTMGDWLEAEQRIRNDRLTRFLQGTQSVKWLPSDIISDTLARIVCQTVESDELLESQQSQVVLLALSLRHNNKGFDGEAGINRVRAFPPIKRAVLTQILWVISGLKKPGEEEDELGRPTNESPTNSDPASNGES